MRVAHVGAGVIVGSAERHGEKSLLFGDLALHVDVVEEMRDPAVCEDFTIKKLDGRVDCAFAAQALV